MEENVTRALVIGVSVFVITLTISLLMIYFNIAKDMATAANSRIDIADTYDAIVTNKEKTSAYLTGVEIRELIRKYAGNKSVRIDIKSIKGCLHRSAVMGAIAKKEYIEEWLSTDKCDDMYTNINNRCGLNYKWIDKNTGMINETYLSVIDPGWEKNLVEKEFMTDGNTGEKLIELNLSLGYGEGACVDE